MPHRHPPEEDPVRRWAAEAGLPFAARIGRHAAFDEAALRGEPAWRTDPAVEREIAAVARIAWPLLGAASKRHEGVLAALRGGRRRDQLEDHARRKGIRLAEAERWLAPNLADGE
jgi:hypothetical protein